ncbi:protein CFAP95 isoform X2 [Sphaerodactylus townsendi]|uniref:protein CFAP95 isoform X2 n=1 Tax=Sphaerodactylus townsendi TaxID=933632 RepID=UPI00202767DA|nr:protein CFAP95 isoform X2 [Sphaerodactylus townsendi]
MELGPPDVMQRRGALTLRSNFAHYGRPTFVYLWHQNREAEPKDYDIHEIPSGSKNLCRSTYWRLGTINEKWKTTYQDYMSQPFRLKEFKELNIKKPLLDEDNFEDAVISRFLDTIYQRDYVAPYDYTTYVTAHLGGYSVIHRKCHSQFTDTADYRRHGINTWQDESGIYANSDLRQKVLPATSPILSNVNEDTY